MKTCPQCHKEYEDDLRFCLDDGAQLAGSPQSQQPTESFTNEPVARETEPAIDPPSTDTVFRPGFEPPQVQGKRTSYLMPLVTGLFGIFILFLVGVIGAGWYFLRSDRSVAVANTNPIEPPPVNAGNPDLSSNTTSVSNSTSANSVFNSGSNATNSNARQNTKIDAANDRLTVPTPQKTPLVGKEPPLVTDRPTPPPNVPKTISGGVLNGRAISLPKPPYPPAARAARASGPVAVQVLIDEDGRVVSASAVSGHPLLRSAAEAAARGARFSPTMLSGQRVKVSGVITYNFVP